MDVVKTKRHAVHRLRSADKLRVMDTSVGKKRNVRFHSWKLVHTTAHE